MGIMSEVAQQVGNMIREFRKSKGLTQKDLGERLVITEGAYNRYESGQQNFYQESNDSFAW